MMIIIIICIVTIIIMTIIIRAIWPKREVPTPCFATGKGQTSRFIKGGCSGNRV